MWRAQKSTGIRPRRTPSGLGVHPTSRTPSTGLGVLPCALPWGEPQKHLLKHRVKLPYNRQKNSSQENYTPPLKQITPFHNQVNQKLWQRREKHPGTIHTKAHNIKYFWCFQMGHKSNECPSKKQLQLTEGDFEVDVEEEWDNNYYKVEESIANESELLNCVVEWIIIASKQPSPSQRHSIFWIQTTINGKVYVNWLLIAVVRKTLYPVR